MSVTPLVLKQNIWQLKKKMDLLWFTFSELLAHGYMDHGWWSTPAHFLGSQETNTGRDHGQEIPSKAASQMTNSFNKPQPPSFPHLQTPLIRTLRVQSLLSPTFEHYSNIPTCGGYFKPKSQQYLSCETHKWDPSDLCKGLSVQRLLKDSPQGNNIRTTQDLLEIQVQGLDSHSCIRNL